MDRQDIEIEDITAAVGRVGIKGDLQAGWFHYEHTGFKPASVLFAEGHIVPTLISEVEEWCAANLRKHYVTRTASYVDSSVNKIWVYLFDDVDLIHFKMRWV